MHNQVIPLLKNGQPTGELAVVLPKDASDISFLNHPEWNWKTGILQYHNSDGLSAIGMPEGNFEIVSILTPSTATPEQKELLADNGMLVENPYGKTEPWVYDEDAGTEREFLVSDWNRAQSKLVEKVVIIKEV